jgi:hypothetical protein
VGSGSYIFQTALNSPGSVKVLKLGKSSSPAMISVDGFKPSAAIVTQIDIAQHVNTQFMPTLADLVYVYSFGDRMGEAMIHGLAFNRACGSTGTSAQGISEVLDYYNNHRATEENRKVVISLGRSHALNGFLTDIRLSTGDAALRTTSFVLTLAALPGNRK